MGNPEMPSFEGPEQDIEDKSSSPEGHEELVTIVDDEIESIAAALEESGQINAESGPAEAESAFRKLLEARPKVRTLIYAGLITTTLANLTPAEAFQGNADSGVSPYTSSEQYSGNGDRSEGNDDGQRLGWGGGDVLKDVLRDGGNNVIKNVLGDLLGGILNGRRGGKGGSPAWNPHGRPAW